jgi:alkaline phosphatase
MLYTYFRKTTSYLLPIFKLTKFCKHLLLIVRQQGVFILNYPIPFSADYICAFMKTVIMIKPADISGRKHLFLFISVCLFASVLYSQTTYYTTQNAHSHNDYEQKIPYRMAYDQGFGSIEADIFLRDSELIVAHDEKELQYNRSFRKLYLENIDSCAHKNKGYPYKDSSHDLQLLIDIKTDSVRTLDKLIIVLEQFPALIHNRHIFLVITGNRPSPDSFSHYPDYIWFDGVLSRAYSKDQLSRIKMLSDDFQHYSHWRGDGVIPVEDFEKLRIGVAKAHEDRIRVRFWNAPDFSNAWTQLIKLQVDFINTDHIDALAQYLQTVPFHLYHFDAIQ